MPRFTDASEAGIFRFIFSCTIPVMFVFLYVFFTCFISYFVHAK